MAYKLAYHFHDNQRYKIKLESSEEQSQTRRNESIQASVQFRKIMKFLANNKFRRFKLVNLRKLKLLRQHDSIKDLKFSLYSIKEKYLPSGSSET